MIDHCARLKAYWLSKGAIVFPLMQLNVNTYANSIIESSFTLMKFMEVLIMYICVIVSTVDVNDCIFCVNEQQKVYTVYLHKMRRRNRIPIEHRERIVRAFEDKAEVTC